MLPLKIFWLDMDKFLSDAAKIIDQLGSVCFVVCVWGGGGGGEFVLSSCVTIQTADDHSHQKHQENYL